ncbi:MAG: SpoIIE family protein phosphatase [Symploca sp. SIO2B6]|nr:SpoIIE family protein phosphatase [Symploca sp. SIO2B6]
MLKLSQNLLALGLTKKLSNANTSRESLLSRATDSKRLVPMENEKLNFSIVENLKEVIFQTDQAGQLKFLNSAWTEITGFTLDESLGKNFLEFIHPDDRLLHWEKFQSLVESHQDQCRYHLRCLTKNGSLGWLEVYACVILIEGNGAIVISGTLNDLSGHKHREQLLIAQQAAINVLAESTSLKEAIPKVLQAICENLEWVRGEFWSAAEQAKTLRCLESWQIPVVPLSEFENATRNITLAPGIGLPGRVWVSGEAIWSADLTKDSSFCRTKIAAAVGLHAAFAIPIIAEDEMLGVMLFFSHSSQQPDTDLLQVMAVIGCQLGQFIKRKQAEEELQRQNLSLQFQLHQAAEYVRSLLPAPLTGALTIEQQFVPSLQLGGDIFDYYWLDANNLVVYLLDVAGHGVRSALLSVSVLNLLRTQSLYNTDFYQPWTVLAELNRVFQINDNGNDYFTIWYGVYNQLNRKLVYACAGHPPGILLSAHPDAAPIIELSTANLPIGILSDSEFDDDSCEIQPGSTLYIFSDGAYEIPHPIDKNWELKTFVKFLADYQNSGNGNLEEVLDYIQSMNNNKALDDDFSLLKVNFA